MQDEGAQIFVRTSDVAAIERVIRQYVEEHGCTAIADIESDGPSPMLGRRTERTFLISRPAAGVTTIWEDGNWADRRLAQWLSEALSCEAYVILISDSTVSWGYAEYDEGREVERHAEEDEELDEAAAAYAEEHGLPYALVYLEDPNLRAWLEEEAGEGYPDPELPPELMEAVARQQAEEAGQAGEPPDVEDPGVEADDDDGSDLSDSERQILRWQEDFERDRAAFTELRLTC